MPELTTRILKKDYTIEEVLKDKSVVNYSITNTPQGHIAAIEIFLREVRHNPDFLTSYNVLDEEHAHIMLLVFLNFDAEKYFVNDIDDQFNTLHATPEYWENVRK